MSYIVQRESMLKVHVEIFIIFMHYKIMLLARTSLLIVSFMNISYLFFNGAALLGLPSFALPEIRDKMAVARAH